MSPMFILAVLAILPAVCVAQLIPTAPGPGQIYMAGSQCTMQWQVDTTGTWQSVTIDLMTGSNNNMSLVTNVASGLDGTSSSSYNWTCPQVNPYSSIYFYQFTQPNSKSNNTPSPAPVWTTRFTIASLDGVTTPPEHSTQPNGDLIPWGVGQLIAADENKIASSSSSSDISTSTTSTASINPMIPVSMQPLVPNSPKAAPPEVTLNVPAPKPNQNARRESFARMHAREAGIVLRPRCTTSILPACRRRLRNRCRQL